MLRACTVGSAALVLLAGVTSTANADPGVGRPFDPNCYGQTVRGFAQTYGGAAHAAEAFGVTVQQGHNILRTSCFRFNGQTGP